MAREHIRIINNIYKSFLKEEGFEKVSKTFFIKETPKHILAIEIQNSQFDEEYFLNIGLHFKCVPNFFGISKRFCKEIIELLCWKRLEDTYEYLENLQAFEADFINHLRDSVNDLKKFQDEYSTEEKFLGNFDLGNIQKLKRSIINGNTDIELMKEIKFLGGYTISSITVLCYSLGYLASYLGQIELAKDYFQEGTEWCELDDWDMAPFHKALSNI